MRYSFLGPFTITILVGENTMEDKLTEELSRKHTVFPVSLVKPYHHTGVDRFYSRKKSHIPQDIVKVEDFPMPVKKILKSRKIRINENHHRHYFARLKNQTSDKDKW
ncbi:hypothetical protein O181_120471 [Austropuccinia psidii MF-1]|uniref:Uncharacterized protein n=1 Tax=Austropuccinia psidii MF-1 TaxID=1389203 RepID=A0A9Q3KHP9_9BASI|nr:hypothetical protein [Austropuccinia psidii MF-1]